MKKHLGYLLLTLVVVACGTPAGQFRLEGRLRNFNQGEFYLYSIDDGRGQIDTIHVVEGRFALTKDVERQTTFVLVFPNFSELPIFAESGASIDIQGDASHLKETKVAGTEENDLMTEFRLNVADMTPPQLVKAAEAFIREHPERECSRYLLDKYFVQQHDADYKKVAALAALLVKARPDEPRLTTLQSHLKKLKNNKVGQQLPRFSATDVKGKLVSNASLTGDVNVVTVWATWDYSSQNLQRQLRELKKTYGSRLGLVSICLDANRQERLKMMERDSVNWGTVCDGKMFDSPVMAQLGLADVPCNIMTDKSGKITAIDQNQTDLKIRIRKTLK
jgi:hypothetical protein